MEGTVEPLALAKTGRIEKFHRERSAMEVKLAKFCHEGVRGVRDSDKQIV